MDKHIDGDPVYRDQQEGIKCNARRKYEYDFTTVTMARSTGPVDVTSHGWVECYARKLLAGMGTQHIIGLLYNVHVEGSVVK